MSAVLPIMWGNQFGKIINVSSIGSEMGLPFRGFYSASKAALDKVTGPILIIMANILSIILKDIVTEKPLPQALWKLQ